MTDVAGVFREEWGRSVALLTRVTGDLSLAEDSVQDAFTAAFERWPRSGVPANPAAWIVTTARNDEEGRALFRALGFPFREV